ncbi:MAG TPA: terminase family protein [Allosphingosinicella sp.]
MKRSEAVARLRALRRMTAERRRVILSALPAAAIAILAEEWWWRAHGGQHEPARAQGGGPWRVWAIVAGRGFGKTRAGAEWVWARAREGGEGTRIALVAATREEAARVMVEGESGLIASARWGERPLWIPTRGLVRFPSGAEGFVYSAERPEALRGPQHHFAWVDELAKWPRSTSSGQVRAEATWDNLVLGLRLGTRPRTILTTTPRPVPLLKRILALPHTASTSGRTDQNPHSARDFREAVAALYAGTRLGRQELDGLLLEDLPGALWTREMIERARVILPGTGRETATRSGVVEGGSCQAVSPLHQPAAGPPPRPGEDLARIVVGVDPPASAHGDSCGIVVCGLGRDGTAYVLADLTVGGKRPEGWARRVAAAAEAWEAQLVVAEKNQGGDMVESVLRAASFALPIRLVAATRAKAARAEPIALHFEAGRAKLAGSFPELEDQLCGLTYAGYQGPGNSPDRADAMVWAMTELFAKAREPRISVL